MSIVFAAAGHVDHGKTALVKALTGTDTDTLPEEKRRGLTIQPGYAPLSNNAVIIDMPGHESFLQHMAEAAFGVDCALICVDAGEGVKPQTREHVKVLEFLGAKAAAAVITKCDLADAQQLIKVTGEVKELLKGTLFKSALFFETSAKSMQGIAELKEYLLNYSLPKERLSGSFFMPVSKVFTKQGHGTVVSGTVFRGEVKKGDTLYIYRGGVKCTVRQLESAHIKLEQCFSGRAALNISCKQSDIKKGSVLCSQGNLAFKRAIGVRLQNGYGLKSGDILQMVLGCDTYTVRITLYESFAFLRAKEPLPACAGQRIILRSSSKELYGGEVLVCFPQNDEKLDKREKQRLKAYDVGIYEAVLFEIKMRGVQAAAECFYFIDSSELYTMINTISTEDEKKRLSLSKTALLQIYQDAGISPPYITEAAESLGFTVKLANMCAEELCGEGELLCLKRGLYISKNAFEKMLIAAESIIVRNGGVTLAALRDELLISRKYARAFLEYCDSVGIYSNIDNVRIKKQ